MPAPKEMNDWHDTGRRLTQAGNVLGVAFIVFGVLSVIGGLVWLIYGFMDWEGVAFQLTGVYLVAGILEIAAGIFIRSLGKAVSVLIDMNIAQLEGPGADVDI